jgi:hypothetical protein
MRLAAGDLMTDACLLSTEVAACTFERIGRQPIFDAGATMAFPYTVAHFDRLLQLRAFAPNLAPYVVKNGPRL